MKAQLVYQTKTAMQSGRAKAGYWIMVFPSDPNWDYQSIMKWPGAHETLGQIHMRFDSQKAAIDFASTNGIELFCSASSPLMIKPKSYAANFTRPPRRKPSIK